MQTSEEKNNTKKDCYVCPDLHTTITEVIHDGRVPNMIVCPACKQKALSMGFHVNQNFEATFEWYRPNDAELLKLTSGLDKPSANRIHDHVNKGLLLCRAKEKSETKTP